MMWCDRGLFSFVGTVYVFAFIHGFYLLYHIFRHRDLGLVVHCMSLHAAGAWMMSTQQSRNQKEFFSFLLISSQEWF